MSVDELAVKLRLRYTRDNWRQLAAEKTEPRNILREFA
jgi:hypothetical protein